jgi:acetyltransferase
MSIEGVKALLNPTSIAVVGASETSVWASEIVSNIRKWDFAGDLHMVNPKRSEAYGYPCYPSVSDVPAKVDHALIVVRAAFVPDVLRDCARAGVRGVTVIAAGFAEAGTEGASLAEEISRICAEHGIHLIGPNCYGFSNFPSRLFMTRNWIEEEPRATGGLSMIFQSGQLGLSAYGSALQRGIDFRFLISSGNEVVTNANDYFEYFVADPHTRVLGGAIERIPEPARFRRIALQAREAGKPIVLLKLGISETGSQIAASHTGAVAGIAAAVRTFLEDLGVIVVSTIDELVETAGLLDQRGWPKGERTVFLGGSGGSGEFFADMADDSEIRFPPVSEATTARISVLTGLDSHGLHNPMDLTATGFSALAEVAPLLSLSGEFDIVVSQGEEPLSDEVQGAPMVSVLRRHMEIMAGINEAGGYGVFLSSADRAPTPFGKEARRQYGVTYLRGKTGVQALSNAIWYGRVASRPPVAGPDVDADGVLDVPSRGTLSENDAKQLLSRSGITVTRDIAANNAEAAVAAAESIGYPVVLKVDSPHIAHKSEIGGVVLNIRDATELREAYEGIIARARGAYPQHDISSVLVCEQIESGTELIVGAVVDPSIGPVLLVGAGGIYVEILKDTALAMPPVTRDEAERLLRSLRIWPILEGARGRKGVHLESLLDAVMAASRMITRLGTNLIEFDINPLIVTPERTVAGDALIVMKEKPV